MPALITRSILPIRSRSAPATRTTRNDRTIFTGNPACQHSSVPAFPFRSTTGVIIPITDHRIIAGVPACRHSGVPAFQRPVAGPWKGGGRIGTDKGTITKGVFILAFRGRRNPTPIKKAA
jgi:hypothetical protein